jgi:hypothetical protein
VPGRCRGTYPILKEAFPEKPEGANTWTCRQSFGYEDSDAPRPGLHRSSGKPNPLPDNLPHKDIKLRFALSNANAWNENDGCFNYVHFYNNILDYFELTPGPESLARTTSLLSWWTR